MMIGVLVGMVAAASAFAADGARKEAVLEGKYLRVVASAPDFANEGSDSFGRPGIGKGKSAELSEQFVKFNAPLAEERTGAAYSVRMSESENGKPVPDARWHAEFLIKKGGLDPAKAVEIQVPPIAVPSPDAKVVALRAEGVAFDDAKLGKEVIYVIGVSYPDGKVAYAMSGLVLTPVAAFDADPKVISKMASRALTDFLKNTKIERK
ncbi:MAG: hypothetical protein C0489_05235 [Candidatus Accumulibacter sp.]|nr:hypothetical protein [Accumulibacter sp.]